MNRCHACEGTHDVLTIGDLNWCAGCRDGDLPELYSSGVSPMFTSAVVAEQTRRIHDLPDSTG